MADASSTGRPAALLLALAALTGGEPIPAAEPHGVVVVGREAAAAVAAMSNGGDTLPATIYSPGELPTRPPGYRTTDALVIGTQSLGRLDDSRLRALLEYAGSCGRLLLVGTASDTEYIFTRRAGCGGRFVAAAEASAVPETLAHLLETRPVALPTAASLDRLVPWRGGELRLVALFVGGYLVVLSVLFGFRRTRPAAVGFCVLATIAAILLWTGGRRDGFVAWAEVDDGERIARYVSLGVAAATGRSRQEVPLEGLGRYPSRIVGENIETDEETERLRWAATLLATIRIEATGSFPVEPTLRADSPDGRPRVCNRGSRTTEPGWLASAGRIYAIPALAPGQAWRPADGTAATTPLLRLLRARADGLAVLQELTVPGDPGARRAWLLRREAAGAAEVERCAS
ncbi:MAG: hypothetical protein P8172_05275 [Gammaproteobacteria bacterium]